MDVEVKVTTLRPSDTITELSVLEKCKTECGNISVQDRAAIWLLHILFAKLSGQLCLTERQLTAIKTTNKKPNQQRIAS